MSPARLVRALLFLCLIVPFTPASRAQIPPNSSITATPIPGSGHDYLGGQIDTVNPATGSVSLRIPVIIPPSRGITLPFFFSYDTAGANYLTMAIGSGTAFWNTINPGWNEALPSVSMNHVSWTTLIDGGPRKKTCSELNNFMFQDAHGARHDLNLSNFSFNNQNDPCYINTQDWPPAFDATVATTGNEGPIFGAIPSNWTGTPTVTVTDGDGTNFFFPAGGGLATSVVDRNGNSITINSTTHTNPTYVSFNYVDTSGRTVLQDSGIGISPETLTVSGLGASYTLTWAAVPTPTFTTPITTLSGSCSTAHNTWGSPAVSNLKLPNGQSYSFSYDSVYGLLNKVTYPAGGYVRYVWGMNSAAEFIGSNLCDMEYGVPAITDRYVSFDGTHEVLHQTFTYSTTWNWPSSAQWTSKQTTVTTYDLVRNTSFKTIYNYSGVPADVPPNSAPLTSQDVVESSVLSYETTGSLIKTVSKTWRNVRLLTGQTTNYAANNQVNQTGWGYNSNELQTEQDDYDFGTGAPGSLLRKTLTSYLTTIIDKPTKVQVYDSSGTNLVAETDYTYDNPAATATSGIVEHNTTGVCVCGNLTAEAHWLNASGTTLTTTYTNDDTGQRLSMTDPRGNTTTYSYTDNYSSGIPPGPTNTYLTQVTHPQTGGVNHIEKYSYAYASGEVTSSTDQNNLVTTYKYNDSLSRLTETDFPDGGVTTQSYNDAPYNPSTPSPSTTTTKKINSSANLVTLVALDGLGHTIRSEITSDPQGTVYTDTAYDGLGRVYTISNPYRSGTDPTTSSGTTTYAYDALNRKTSVTYPDNAVLTTAYCGASTLVTDPASRWRRSRTDGLGRLVEVDEPNAIGATVNSNGCPGTGEPVWVTSHTVDTLGNLKQVVQNGSHTRTFTYDLLSRLLTSSNPEVGTITYNYDSDSNCASPNSFAGLLVSKIDARGIRTCAQYDALNRQTVLNYSNGDPTVTTTYDGSACLGLSACQNIGHPTSITDAAGSESWAYQTDSANLRSVHANQRTTSGITKTSTYYLDLVGNLTSVTYPTGRIVNYTYDAANRPQTAVDSANGITYAAAQVSPPAGCLTTGICYTPEGTEYSAAIGKTSSFNGVNFSETYNNRLQPLEIKASSSAGNAIDVTYSFVDSGTSKNAGHVNSITNNLDNTRSQTFSYDQLNRISGALTTSTYATSPTHCWGEAYTVDAWGNLNSIAATTNSAYTGCTEESGFTSTADGNNHLPAWAYDASGNATSDGTYSYQYDAESQIKTANGYTYVYDGSGRRVSKSGTNSKLYWYGSGGEILAETTTSGTTLNEYIFFAGKRIAMLPAGGSAQYYVEDLLGSSRVMTTNTGTLCYDADFYPYGGERTYTNSCPTANNYKFEGKERDTETGNDDFGARYYSNRFGRWLSADWSNVPVPVPYANLTNPQTLNLYAMVSDDPETSADLDGHVENASQGLSQPGDSGGPTCAATGQGGSGSATSGACGGNQTSQTDNQQAAEAARQQAQVVTTWNAISNPIAETLTVTKTDTTTTPQADGSTTTVVQKTTVTFSTSASNPGSVVNATIQGSMSRTADGKTTTVPLSSPLGDKISKEAASSIFGQKAFSAAEAASVPGRAELFVRAVNSDKKGARDMAIGVASLLAPVPHGWHLGHALFDVGMAAYDLIKGWREAVHPE